MIKFDPTLVHEWLARSARAYPQKTAVVFEEKRLSYQNLEKSSTRLAKFLIHKGVQKQDHVALFLPNSIEAVIALFGILKAGSAFILLEKSLKPEKLSYILKDSGCKAIITHNRAEKTVRQACENLELDTVVLLSGCLEDSVNMDWPDPSLGQTNWEKINLPRIIDIDLATIIYTSGSTGLPKGVMSTHANMISAARSIIQYVENEPNDIILNALPLSFDYGLYQLIMSVMFGGTLVLEPSFLYLHSILETMVREKVTGLPLVPTMAAMLLNLDNLDAYDLKHLRYLTNTGAALPEDHIRKLTALFPSTRFYSMFGLTECKRVCYMPPHKLQDKPGSVGIAMPNCEVMLVDANGNQVPPGEIGELVIRGSNVMQGYRGDMETTNRTYKPGRYPAERWLHSGDYFKMDEDGDLYFLGRKDDMIKSRGERVSAKEVENMIHQLDGVHEAAVIGIHDPVLGQAIKAFVVLKEADILNARDIQKHCAQNLESFAAPKYVEICPALPKTPNGKIDKKQLKKTGGP